jgi:hypothetical protein
MPVAAEIRPENSLRCSRLIDSTPERPLSWAQVTRRLTPRNISRPPSSLPLGAD